MKERLTGEKKEAFKMRLLKVLAASHVGATRIVGMGELYSAVFGESWGHRINDTRMLRDIVVELQMEGIGICSRRSRVHGGYYLASSTSELADFCGGIEREVMKKLGKVAALKRMALPALLGQMALGFDGVDGPTETPRKDGGISGSAPTGGGAEI